MFLRHRLLFRLFIQTFKTPNPNFLKFVPGNELVMGAADPIDIKSIEEANLISPLARKLFKVEGVTQVFYGKSSISIAKQQQLNWNDLKPLIFELIESHYSSGEPLLKEPSQNDTGINQTDSETVKLIKTLLVSRVRPFVQDDGGDVNFVSFDQQKGVLTLKMMGSCSGCPSSEATLKGGILKMMKHYVGEVNDVVSDTVFKEK